MSNEKPPIKRKYTVLLDERADEYKRRLKYIDRVDFSDMIRAMIELCEANLDVKNHLMAIARGDERPSVEAWDYRGSPVEADASDQGELESEAWFLEG